MLIREILTEGRDAPLYHWMKIGKALDVFKNDNLKASWTHNIPGLGKFIGTSLTRNKRLIWPAEVRLTFDQSKLAHTNRIIPLDGEFVLNNTNPDYRPGMEVRDRVYNKAEAERYLINEEFVVGDVHPLHKYITHILMMGETDVNDHFFPGSTDITQQYAIKFGIPFETAK